MTKSQGINKPHHRWTWVQEEAVRRLYGDCLTSDLARALGLTTEQVHRKANKLGLRKSLETIAEIARQRARETDNGHKYGFPKGHVPANKGVKRPPGWSPGRMRETQFVKGHKGGSRAIPVGGHRVNPDGFVEVKLNDDPGPYFVRWKPVHRHLWEQANGPVPKGCVIAFKPGMKTTDPKRITLDVIECLTFAQNLARNSIHNMPPALVKVTQLRGALTRQINKLSRSHDGKVDR